MKLLIKPFSPAVLLISTTLSLLYHPPIGVYTAAQKIPVKIGDSIQTVSENDIGRGFKLNVKEGENPYKNHVFNGEIEADKKTDEVSSVRIVTNQKEMKDLLDVSGSITVGLYGGAISGTGKGGYFSNVVSSKKQVKVFYRSRKLAFFKRLKPGTSELTQDANDLALSPDEFMKKFGTKYVSEIVYGAQLDVSFTIRSSEEMNAKEIFADLKGSIGKGKLDAKFAAKFNMTKSKTQSLYQMEIAAEATGALVTIPANPSFNETITIIKSFNEEYAEKYENFDIDNQDLLGQIEPIQIVLGNTKDRMKELDELQLEVLEERMEDLGEVFLSSFVLKSQLNRINNELRDTYKKDPKLRVEMYNPYIFKFEEAINKIDDKINDCLAFRSEPISAIVSGNVPEIYPLEASTEDDFVRGLKGESFIKAPVTIGDHQPLKDIYYEGFALMDDNGEMIPWMKGQLKNVDGEQLLATADTPEKLYKLAAQYIKLPSGNLCHENTRIDYALECKEAGLSLGGCLGNDGKVSIVDWDNAPYGCFMKANTPSAIYLNTNTDGKGGNGEFSALCRFNRKVYDSLTHTIVGTSTKCPIGSTLTKEQCEKAGEEIGGRLKDFKVVEGYWDDRPSGCFLSPSDDNTIHYNKNMYGRGKIGISLVCRKEPFVPEDFTMTEISLDSDGNSQGMCAPDAILDEGKCLEAGLALGGILRDGTMTEGNWTNTPPGCFLNPGEDNAIHYNVNMTAADVADGVYSALCLKPIITSYF